jgi:hypothetical protein
MSSYPLDYLGLVALAGGGIYLWRRHTRTGANTSTEVSIRKADRVGLVELAPTAPAAAVTPALVPTPPARLHTVRVRCEHLDHFPGREPVATVALASLNRDIRTLIRVGWGGSDHTNICYYHNPAQAVDLRTLHVVCRTGCGERDTIRVADAVTEFGRLRQRGWVNTADDPGPYCAGTRDRPRW